MIRKHQAGSGERLDCAEETRETRWLVQVRRFGAELAVHLREDAAAEPVFFAAQIDQQELGLACIGAQPRRQCCARVADRRERGDDERQRRDDFFLRALLAPRGAHRQRILAHRNRDADRGAEFQGDRLDRVEQCSVFPGIPGRGHPVGGKLDAIERIDARGGQVGQRFRDSHAARGRAVDQRKRRALAERERLAGIAFEIEQGHRAIGDRHLPGADERVARAKPAHGPVADRDQEGLVGDRRVAKHAIGRVLEVHPVRIERAQSTLFALHVAKHFRRLAEQRFHREVHRPAAKLRILDDELAVRGCGAKHGERAALSFADRAEAR